MFDQLPYLLRYFSRDWGLVAPFHYQFWFVLYFGQIYYMDIWNMSYLKYLQLMLLFLFEKERNLDLKLEYKITMTPS